MKQFKSFLNLAVSLIRDFRLAHLFLIEINIFS